MIRTKCTYSNCEKSSQCKRFLKHEDGEEFEFKNICFPTNNYEWFWQVNKNITDIANEQNKEKIQ